MLGERLRLRLHALRSHLLGTTDGVELKLQVRVLLFVELELVLVLVLALEAHVGLDVNFGGYLVIILICDRPHISDVEVVGADFGLGLLHGLIYVVGLRLDGAHGCWLAELVVYRVEVDLHAGLVVLLKIDAVGVPVVGLVLLVKP